MDLGEKWLALTADLGAAEVAAGDVLLASILGNGKSDARANVKVDTLESERKSVEHALASARNQRPGAITALWTAEAAALESQAATASADADQRQVRTDELLAALKDHEGCEYVPHEPPRGPRVTVVTIPQTVGLRSQAANLKRRAQQLRRQPIDTNGSIHADSREAVIAALRALDPSSVGPALSDAVRCYERLAEAEREYRRKSPQHADDYQRPDAPVNVTIHWKDSRIDTRKSSVTRSTMLRGAYAVVL